MNTKLSTQIIGILVIGCLLFSAPALAQDQHLHACGVTGKVDWLEKYQLNPDSYPLAKNDDLIYIPLTIHILGTDNGDGYIGIKTVLDNLCTLNEDFAETGFYFFIQGDIRFIDNTDWYDHEEFGPGYQMMQNSNVPNTINSYFVESPAGNCGYAIYSLGIAMAKNCTGLGDHTWSHEVGHYLSLPHPFVGLEGQDLNYDEPLPEFVNGRMVEKRDSSNCTQAADGFCDTPADYLNFRWTCTNSDTLSQQVQLDPDSVSFRSLGSFIMSYARDNCQARFSGEQMQAMQANVADERPYLITIPPTEDLSIDQEPEPLSPMEDEIVPADGVTLQWSSVENASMYLVEVSKQLSFAGVFTEQFVSSDTIFEVPITLELDRKYFYRITPFNSYNNCGNNSSDRIKFFTDISLNSREQLAVNEALIYPNPVDRSNAIFQIQALASSQGTLKILDARGRLIRQQSVSLVAGQSQRFELATQDLPSGLYHLQLLSNDGQLQRKFLVQ